MVQRLTALLSLGVMLMTDVLAETNASRELTRHTTGSAPEELNVNAKDSFNPSFMKDMRSSCRPEKDGYFGSTYDEPVRLTYGFRIETKPLSSIVDMIDLVEDKIVDSILSQSFPNLCGFGGRRLSQSRASGFRFLKLVGKRKTIICSFDAILGICRMQCLIYLFWFYNRGMSSNCWWIRFLRSLQWPSQYLRCQ